MEENEQTSQQEIEVREEDEDLRELFQAEMERVMTTIKDDIEERKKKKTHESKTKRRNKTECQQDHGKPPIR